MSYTLKTECRCCGGTNLHKFIDLTDQPLANSYLPKPDTQPAYPLATNVCIDCWHTQLTVVVDPDAMFKNYSYVSGTSQTLRDYFRSFAARATALWGAAAAAGGLTTRRVLDIACNDGSQLDAFKALGWETYGVDPAENLVPMARNKGHTIYPNYWTRDISGFIKHNPEAPGAFDVIVAQNVFAHTDDILEFLLACKEVMHDASILMIQTSQANMYENGEFDTIYHEHLSFFNTNSMNTIVERAGMTLQNVEKTSIHGTSYVFLIGKKHSRGESVGVEMMNEEDRGLFSLSTYTNFGQRAEVSIRNLQSAIKDMRRGGFTVVGYGAAAKGMTVLNYGKIRLDFIIDDSPLKQGMFTPGMNIPIYSSDILADFYSKSSLKLAFIPLAWNFFDEIKTRILAKRTNEKDLFIRYFPKMEVSQ